MRALRRTLVHDWPVITLVLLNLLGIGMFLGEGSNHSTGSGYRVIDTLAVQRLLDKGELNRHQARWYQTGAAPEGQRPSAVDENHFPRGVSND